MKDQERKLAEQLIHSLAAPFEPQKYRDEYQENVRALIAAKLQGQEVAEAPQPHMAPVIDLMEALKKSLAEKHAPTAAERGAAQVGPVPVAKKPPARVTEPAADRQTRRGRKKAAG